jgi:DNA-binding LacI/PurR family transcriptional regulator
MGRLCALPNPPTAVFAINDVVALGFLDYCAHYNL